MKSALITGVSGGIGQATAQHLMGSGWHVYGSDINESEISRDLDGFFHGDIAQEQFWTETILPSLDEIDLYGLVNNAALQSCSPIQSTSLEEWNSTIAVNLSAAFLSTKLLTPLLGKTKGSIVNVSSVHAAATSAGMAAYVASKGGLQAFTRAAAIELAEMGIRVNAVLPGATDTMMLEAGLKRQGENIQDLKHELTSRTPLRRIAHPLEVAKTIEFLLDGEKSSFITGSSLNVDGGVLAKLSSE